MPIYTNMHVTITSPKGQCALYRISATLPPPQADPSRIVTCSVGPGKEMDEAVLSHTTHVKEDDPIHLPRSRRITGTAHRQHARAPEDSTLTTSDDHHEVSRCSTRRRWNAPRIRQNRTNQAQEIPSIHFSFIMFITVNILLGTVINLENFRCITKTMVPHEC